MIKALKEVDFVSKKWFVDYRLKEIRECYNPHNVISFDDIISLVSSIIELTQ